MTARRRRLLGGATALLGAAPLAGLLAGCDRRGPLHLGFLGTLSRRAADLGEAGRNGVMLAIEQRNAAGGLDGLPVRLTLEDDGQDAEQATRAMRALLQAGVHAVIGPFTSAMATAAVPLADAAGLPLLSPTVTSMDFHGKADHFFRLHRTTRDNARDYAQVLQARGLTRLAVILDEGNRSFSNSWLAEFRQALQARGGALVAVDAFRAGAEGRVEDLLRRQLAVRPQGLLFIASAVDVARLGQRARLLAPGIPLAAAEWAATETLLELGGRALDGLLILQPYDRDDPSPRYRAFVEAYVARFQSTPGYASVAAFDAATVLMQASERRRGAQTLAQALLGAGPFDGLQQPIAFDANGDTDRRVVFTEMRGGRFVVLR